MVGFEVPREGVGMLRTDQQEVSFELSQKPLAPRLSGRAWETLEYLLAGDSEKQVALALGLSTHTVHSYIRKVYEAFGVATRAELIVRFVPQVEGPVLRKLIRIGDLHRHRASLEQWSQAVQAGVQLKVRLKAREAAAKRRAVRSRTGAAPTAPVPQRPRTLHGTRR
jgi:DNA-binding CsgD family transcriptional regulator